jgi:antitoxin (DNA-binding transcriptional repressor) of toxin-antitoxin stability system
MRAVAIRELKNRLSAYLREVAAGEVVLVTDRGRVVAELRKPTSELMRSPTEISLERLAAEGALTLYAETSAVLRWLFDETDGTEVGARLREAEEFLCSRLTLIEVRRIVRRMVSSGDLHETAAADVHDAFALAVARWGVLELTRAVADRAEDRFPVEPVRTLDALHLASALALR